MATAKALIFLFAILVSSTFILAQRSNSSGPSEGGPGSSSGAPSNSTSGGPSGGSSGGPSGGSPGGQPPASQNESSTAVGSSGSGKPSRFDFASFAESDFDSRHKRSPAENQEVVHVRQKRRVINCNYQKHGGFKCLSCKQARRCYPSNRGVLTDCGGNTPYCNKGECSKTKGSKCSGTTSSSSSTSSGSTTSTTSGSTTESDSDSDSDSTSSSSSTSTTTGSSTSSSSSSSSSSSTSTSTSTSSSSTSTSTSTSTTEAE